MKETTNCVRCLTGKAEAYEGIVRKSLTDDPIQAGWCKRCWDNRTVFRGHWQPEMGVRVREVIE